MIWPSRCLLSTAEDCGRQLAYSLWKGEREMENGRAVKLWLRLVFMMLIAISACKAEGRQDANQTPQISKTPSGDITEITLERGICFGQCPVYRVTLRKDGPATYIGDLYVPLIGTYEATSNSCSECNFAALAASLETQGFFNLK